MTADKIRIAPYAGRVLFKTVYIRNEVAIDQIISYIHEGEYCTVLGPRFSEKSCLLQDVRVCLEAEESYVCAYINLWHAESASESDFFSSIALAATQAVGDITMPESPQTVTSGRSLRRFLESYLPDLGRDLILFIDHLEFVPTNLANLLLKSLRAAYTERDSWAEHHLGVVIAGSLSLARLTIGETSPFNIAKLVLIGDLTMTETRELITATWVAADVPASQAAIQRLAEAAAGDRYLIPLLCSRCASIVASHRYKRITRSVADKAIEWFLQEEAERTPPLREAVQAIEENTPVLHNILTILERESVPRRELSLDLSADIDDLRLTGAIKVVGDNYQIKNEIYRCYLKRHFDPGRVGHVLCMAGQWDEAISYLELSIAAGKDAYRADLQAAIINAIYTAKDVGKAYAYLARALSAAFSISSAIVYAANRAQAALNPVQCVREGEVALPDKAPVSLQEMNRAEIQAYMEGDYSLRRASSDKTLLVIPLVIDGQGPIGIITIYDYLSIEEFAEKRGIVLELLGFLRQAAKAIQAVQTQVEFYENEQRLQEVSRVINSSLELKKVLELILDQMQRVVVYDSASIQLLNSDGLKIIACQGFPDSGEVVGLPFPADPQFPNYQVLLQKKPLILEDVRQKYPQFADPFYHAEHVRSWLGVPLLHKNEAMGVITLDKETIGFYTEEDARLATIFANHAAIAIENAKLFAERQKRLEELDKLHQVSQVMTSTLEMQDVLNKIVKLGAGVSSDYTSIVLIGEDKDLYTSAEDFPGVPPLHVRARPNGITQRVIATGEVQPFDEVYDDETHNPELIRVRIRSYVGVPVKLKDKVLGVLFVHSLSPNTFEGQIPLLTTFANWAAIAVENARLYMNAVVTLSEVEKLQSNLIYTLSHELRTLLNEIKLPVTSLLRQDVVFDRETEDDFLLIINEEVDKLEKLVSDFLDMSKLESGHLEMDKRLMVVDEVIRHAMEAVQDQARGHEFVLNLPVQPLMAKGDPEHIEQVLVNLLSNAIKYSPNGGKITVCGKRDGGRINVSVTDEGISISQDEFDRIFQPFYRIDNSATRQAGGIGLGLAICKAIAEAHKGTLEVESSVERGSTFTFVWPATL